MPCAGTDTSLMLERLFDRLLTDVGLFAAASFLLNIALLRAYLILQAKVFEALQAPKQHATQQAELAAQQRDIAEQQGKILALLADTQARGGRR